MHAKKKILIRYDVAENTLAFKLPFMCVRERLNFMKVILNGLKQPRLNHSKIILISYQTVGLSTY